MTDYLPEGRRIDTYENLEAMSSIKALNDAMREHKILEARATVCDQNHNLVVDLGFMKGIIKREDGAIGIREGKVRDIAVISRVNRPVCFVVKGFTKDEKGNTIAILSREEAQRACEREYISTLIPGDVIDGKITHLENFGAFVDIGCGIVALMPIDAISVSRIEHPRERFTVGMDIKAVVRSVEENRISLSHKELLGTWEENAAKFSAGETVAGIIRSVENYGAFVELAPNLAGLAESREGIKVGEQASVFIKSIIPQRMKIKLIIIDTFRYEYNPKPPQYIFNGNHIDSFLYSPQNSDKTVMSYFY
ncbi:MAG: S1 RNA-binding domain-containing protein [Ruminococcus sp.]|nr:S1 RNA-binding domain-containing protein [Ruminococcus sp.]